MLSPLVNWVFELVILILTTGALFPFSMILIVLGSETVTDPLLSVAFAVKEKVPTGRFDQAML